MKKNNLRISVLCYHDIMKTEEMNNLSEEERKFIIDEKIFNKQMKWMKLLGFKTLTLDEFYKWKKGKINLPKRSLLITFDDGLYNNYKYAFPILKKYNLNACIFSVGSTVLDSEINYNKNKYITKDIIDKCKKEYPNIEFHCHSYNLHSLGSVEQKTYEECIEDLNNYERVMGKCDYFAYPYGNYTDNMIKALQYKKYKLAFIYSEPIRATKDNNDYLVPRVNMSFNQKNYKFILKLVLPFIYKDRS